MHDTVVTNAPTPRGSGEPPAGLDRQVLTESTSIVVDAAPAFTEAAVGRLDLAAPLARALDALDAGGRFALPPTRIGQARDDGAWLFGTIWRIDSGTTAERIAPERFEWFRSPGCVKVCWTVDVASFDAGAVLSIASGFAATDERSAARLLDAWSLIGPLSHALREHAARDVFPLANVVLGTDRPAGARIRGVHRLTAWAEALAHGPEPTAAVVADALPGAPWRSALSL